MTFDDPAMTETLAALDAAAMDALPFGVVGLDGENMVEVYSAHEERYSGLSRDIVMGRHFFVEVAPCMNNFLVAERLGEETLDVTLPYVLTFRMRPTPVRLRLLRATGATRRWVLVLRG